MILSFVLLLALTNTDLDIVTLPPSSEVRVPLTPSGRADLKREGTVTRIKIEIDRVAPPSSLAAMLTTYVVWAVSPEGIVDNLGELDLNGVKGQFNATSRLTEFGILITAEPHYMVDRPNAVAVYRSQTAQDPRRKTASIAIGAYDYSKLQAISAAGVHSSVTQARIAFQIAQSIGADRLAPQEFRNAQVALGSLEELVTRAAPLDIVWPTANEAIRWAERAAEISRQSR